MVFMNCPECNKEVEETALSCPLCGFPMKNDVVSEKNETNIINSVIPAKMDKNKIIGIVLCVIGVVLLLSALSPISTAKYKYYSVNYDYYISKYEETRSKSGGGLIGSGYAGVASKWKDMADEANKYMWTNRAISIMLVISGGIFISVGIKRIRIRKKIGGIQDGAN